jgi:hypothetical protein
VGQEKTAQPNLETQTQVQNHGTLMHVGHRGGPGEHSAGQLGVLYTDTEAQHFEQVQATYAMSSACL